MKLSHTRFVKVSKCMSRSGTIQSGNIFCMLRSGQKKARKDEFFIALEFYLFFYLPRDTQCFFYMA